MIRKCISEQAHTVDTAHERPGLLARQTSALNKYLAYTTAKNIYKHTYTKKIRLTTHPTEQSEMCSIMINYGSLSIFSYYDN